jgi:hypothetical protein
MKETQYPNYFVNEQGDIFSTKRGGIKKLKAGTTNGYLQVSICNNNIKRIYVHRLVAETFIPNPQNKLEVNHKNGIKSDNRIENLEWATKNENMSHAVSMGLYRSKLTEEQVIEIRKLYCTKKSSQKQLAKMFDVTYQLISLIVNNKSWKHI